MVALLLAWVITFFVVFAVGDILIVCWNRITLNKSKYNLINTFWIGLSVTSAITVLLSLFIPISIHVLISFLIFAMVYYVIRQGRLIYIFQTIKESLLSLSKWSLLLLFLMLLLVSIESLQSNIHPDFGSYHIQVLKWTEEFAVVPGLGNLHGRYAFNSSFLTLNTLFCYHPSVYQPFYFLNGLAISILFIWIVSFTDKSRWMTTLVGLLYVYFILFATFLGRISSTSTDILVAILLIYVLLNMCRGKKYVESNILLFSIIPLFCVTLKLSAAPIVLLAFYIFYLLLRAKKFKDVGFIIMLSLLLAVPWCARNVMISGYLIYPYPSIDLFDFDWKIPIASVLEERNFIYSWSRGSFHLMQNEEVPFFQWFPYWLKTRGLFDSFINITLLLAIVMFFMNFKKFKERQMALFSWLIAFVGFVLYIYAAPDLRFGIGFVLPLSIIPFLLLEKGDLTTFKLEKLRKGMYIVICLLTFFWFQPKVAKNVLRWQEGGRNILWSAIYPQSVERAKDVHLGMFGEGRYVQVGSWTIKEQAFSYDDELLTTIHLNDGLEFRGDSIKDGFRIKQ